MMLAHLTTWTPTQLAQPLRTLATQDAVISAFLGTSLCSLLSFTGILLPGYTYTHGLFKLALNSLKEICIRPWLSCGTALVCLVTMAILNHQPEQCDLCPAPNHLNKRHASDSRLLRNLWMSVNRYGSTNNGELRIFSFRSETSTGVDDLLP